MPYHKGPMTGRRLHRQHASAERITMGTCRHCELTIEGTQRYEWVHLTTQLYCCAKLDNHHRLTAAEPLLHTRVRTGARGQ